MAKVSLARTHPATSEYVFSLHFSAILAARICMKHSVSWPNAPLMHTTSGVNDACRASLYFLFFSSSADDGIEATSCLNMTERQCQ